MPKACGVDEITVKDPTINMQSCVSCPTCPKGEGASVQCYSTIPPGKRIMCQACVRGETFSAWHGTGICEACNTCSEHNRVTVKNCTLTSNSECGVCKPGSYLDANTGQCEICSSCCGDGRDIKERECEDQKLPVDQVCNVIRSDKCHRNSTTPGPSDKTAKTATPSSPLKGSTVTKVAASVAGTNSSGVVLRQPNPSAPDSLARQQQQADFSSNALILAFSGGSLLLVLVLGVVLYRCFCKGRRRIPAPTMEIRSPESEVLVPFGTGSPRKEESIPFPIQVSETPGTLSQETLLVQKSTDRCREFYPEKVGGRYEASVEVASLPPELSLETKV